MSDPDTNPAPQPEPQQQSVRFLRFRFDNNYIFHSEWHGTGMLYLLGTKHLWQEPAACLNIRIESSPPTVTIWPLLLQSRSYTGRGWMPPILETRLSAGVEKNQCSGFWFRSGCGSGAWDPYLWLTGADSALFVRPTNFFSLRVFLLIPSSKYIYIILQWKKVIKSHKTVEIEVFLNFCLLMEGSGFGKKHRKNVSHPDLPSCFLFSLKGTKIK